MICSVHSRENQVICYHCVILMCPTCALLHTKQFKDHIDYCEHIDSIKNDLSSIGSNFSEIGKSRMDIDHESAAGDIDNSAGDASGIGFLNKRIEEVWTTVKSSSKQIQSLTSIEKDISNHFAQLHEYLMLEEHKMKKPISQDLDSLHKQIDDGVREIKYLINIININNSYTNTTSHTSPATNGEHCDESTAETTDKYSLSNIIESIEENATLLSFIESNRNTLFDSSLSAQYPNLDNNSLDSYLLDSIYRYKQQFNLEHLSQQPINSDYSLNHKIDLDQFKSILNQSIALSKSTIDSTMSTVQTTTNKNVPYIFSTYRNGASLICLDGMNNNPNPGIIANREELSFQMDFKHSSMSTVKVGEYIYIYGGCPNNPQSTQFLKFHTTTKMFATIPGIDGIGWLDGVSLCYDGQDYIYLLGGYYGNEQFAGTVSRFNIHTEKFQTNLYNLNYKGYISISVYFKGLIYIIPFNIRKVVILNPLTMAVEEFRSDQLCSGHAIGACTDGNGNLYLVSSTRSRFIRFNIEARQIEELCEISAKVGIDFFVSMVYHKDSDGNSYIYLFGSGPKSTNHRYSIESDTWEPFFENDKINRSGKGAILITI